MNRRSHLAATAVVPLILTLVLSIATDACGAAATWRTVYDGYGFVHIRGKDVSMAPRASVRQDETHASLAISTRSFKGVDLQMRVKTHKQLRTPKPNAWEVAWVLWRYRDDTHFYYLALKPNGWELGKEDPAYPGAQPGEDGQRYLAT